MFSAIQPDLMLLDLNMPFIDGLTIMRRLSPEARATVPILVLTADNNPTTKYQALADGADDFVTKPFDDIEVQLRVRNLLRGRFAHTALEDTVASRTKDLELSQLEIAQRLAVAAEYRDDDTGYHARRVGWTSGMLAKALGAPPAQVELVIQAAPLHDLGKIGISDSILLKPGKFTETEFAVMRKHTVIGARILSGGSSPLLRLAEEIALHHHERWDGNGYWHVPGREIPMTSRIVAVADVFDAMTHDRPYKAAKPVAEALAEMRSLRETHFDPEVLDAFLEYAEAQLIPARPGPPADEAENAGRRQGQAAVTGPVS
jgi:putative two-component system response regulator